MGPCEVTCKRDLDWHAICIAQIGHTLSTMMILVLNSGSSSLKECLYEIGGLLPENPPSPLWEGRIEWNGDTAAITVSNSKKVARQNKSKVSSRDTVIRDLLATCWTGETCSIASSRDIDAVGHRMVHGGSRLLGPVFITNDVYSVISDRSPFAPLHIQSELEGVRIVARALGHVPQFAVFDTGFHRHMPAVAQTYPGPYEWFECEIRPYGFHGINRQRGFDADQIDEILNKKSGLLGISGLSADMRDILAAINRGHERAKFDGKCARRFASHRKPSPPHQVD